MAEPGGVPQAHCPHLGLRADRSTIYVAPIEGHRCFAGERPQPIDLAHQQQYCLTAACVTCRRYVAPSLPAVAPPRPAPLPAPLATEEAEAGQTRRRGPAWLTDYVERASKLELMLLSGLVVFALGFAALYLVVTRLPALLGGGDNAANVATFVTPIGGRPTSPAALLPGGRPSASPTVPASATPTPDLGLAAGGQSILASAAFLPTPTLAPGQFQAVLNPLANSVGWVASSDRVNHFGDRNLHAGFFEDQQYHGAFQVSLAPILPGSRIETAVVELVGLSGENMGAEGTWSLKLLDAAEDANWPSATYERIHSAKVQDTIDRPLTPKDLAPRKVNVFKFSPEQAQALERRLENKVVSFRLDGPSDGGKNLFTWDTGYGGGFGARPVLRVVYQPPPTLTPVVITVTPAPQNLATAAALVVQATAFAREFGTPTPFPTNVVIAPTVVVVTNTPTPENAATAEWVQIEEQARVLLYGTRTPMPTLFYTATPIPPTSTPLPPRTPTPIPPTITNTPLPLLLSLDALSPTPTGTPTRPPTATPSALPAIVRGKIAFISDRIGKEAVFVVDPQTKNVLLLTDRWAYDRALDLDKFSPDFVHKLFVRNGFATTKEMVNGVEVGVKRPNVEIWVQNQADGYEWDLITGPRTTYDPVWSPDGVHIAFVSQEAGNDEIYVVDRHTHHEDRLTTNKWEWDKHPSYSPDGTRIVFWSNRDSGRKALWLMNADGSNPQPLMESAWNDWDPVWIK